MQIIHDSQWLSFFEQLENASESTEVSAIMSKVTQKMRFSHWAYVSRLKGVRDSGEVRLVSNYPVDWARRYLLKRYVTVDTSVSLAEERGSTVSWADAQRAGGHEFWTDASAFGLRHGVAHPSWDRHGTLGILTMARDSVAIDAVEFKSVAPFLAWLSGVLHTRAFAGHPQVNSELQPLSDRELQVLKWTAKGKTAGEIAKIIGVTTRTVNFHVGNILWKLNVSNKIQAAVRATMLGIL